MIEKFNDISALEKSYESLEREFTKKCQELSELKKQVAQSSENNICKSLHETNDENSEETHKSADCDTQNVDTVVSGEDFTVVSDSINFSENEPNGAVTDVVTSNETKIADGEKIISDQSEIIKETEDEKLKTRQADNSDKFDFGSLDFRTKASEFLALNPEAREYAKEISKILLTDRTLFKTADPFKLAFALAKVNNLAGPSAGSKPETVTQNNNSGSVEAVEPMGVSTPVAILSSRMVGNAPAGARSGYRTLSEASESLLKLLR